MPLTDCAAGAPNTDGTCISTSDSSSQVLTHCKSGVGSSLKAAQPARVPQTDTSGFACANYCRPGNATCGYVAMESDDATHNCIVFAKGVGSIVSVDEPGWVVFEQVKMGLCSS
jgi:hypothetical protein